jgi:hypothetical protein
MILILGKLQEGKLKFDSSVRVYVWWMQELRVYRVHFPLHTRDTYNVPVNHIEDNRKMKKIPSSITFCKLFLNL